MRKFMQIFCLLLALLFVLSACGGATEQNDEGKDTDEGNNTQNGGTTDEGEGSTGEGSGEEAPNPDAGLSLDKNEVELKVGETATLVATFVPKFESDDQTVTLESSDAKVVTVEGMTLTAVGAGTATVTAKNADGSFTATCKVTVSASVAVEQIITVVYDGKTETADVTADPAKGATVTFGGKLVSGKKLTVTLPEGSKYLGITIGSGVKEAILYVPGGTYEFIVPSDLTAIYPGEFANSAKVAVRIPSAEELTTSHNLALNPYDKNVNLKLTGYPHVSSNNQYNTNEFAARCAIDGFTTNTGHGRYPQQSWGPKDVVNKTDYFTVDFKRTVVVDEIVIYLRGDFGHDAYFSTIVAQFLDADGKVVKNVALNLKMVRNGQKIEIPSVEACSVKLTNFIIDKTKGGPWTGLAEVEINGTDKLG
ncbi:MAG: Ig domain-containing protein [Ruminococcaceae bacterium]|nr:Ig domain-containing protein [Oscillospiraceae bacterium]